MCNSKMKSSHVEGLTAVAKINGRPVLQPTSNRVNPSETTRPLKKTLQKSLSMPTSLSRVAPEPVSAETSPRATPPLSPTTKPKKNISLPAIPKTLPRSASMASKRSKKGSQGSDGMELLELVSGHEVRAPGSIAAAQREQAMMMQVQRKMRIAHYGRTPEKLEGMVVPVDPASNGVQEQEKRCGFITPNSDPLYVAYHDEEWGVAVHDDKMLFELLILAGAQVGLDWTSILKKRNDFRTAFAGFDAEVVSKFTSKQKASITAEYGLDLGRVRGVVDNANRILEVTREFGSLDNYIWGFVNHKPITPSYKSSRKIPVKTSKSESISKDMVRRGFRFVGPTVVHTFMQAAGLTNDHIVACPRHHHCISLSSNQL